MVGRRRSYGYVAALSAVGLVSLFIGLVQSRVHLANVSMLYLLAVFASAIFFGGRPAVLAAVAAFLTFDFFFTEPYHTFAVADPAEWIALLLFLVTALITSQLAAALRRSAAEARLREHEAALLYEMVRGLNQAHLERGLQDLAERLRDELRLAGVAIRIGVGSYFSARGAAGDVADAPEDLRRVVPVESPSGRTGEIVLVRALGDRSFSPADDRLLAAAADQIGAAAERARLQHEATDAEVLRRTDELKSALINAVSHDVRTPLASIITAAGSLRRADVPWSDQERREFAADIEHEAQRLNRLFGNLLDLSRVEGGTLRPEKSWYDVGALVDDVLGRLRPVTETHRVVVDVPDDLPPVLLDPTEIDQVLSNLIENAARHTPPGTEISVRARRDGGEVRLEVADRGPGIPTAALARLFDAFYQGHDQGAPRTKGLGLGLAIAKGLVEAHGGRIWAENRPEGGARFVIALPIGIAEGDAVPVPRIGAR